MTSNEVKVRVAAVLSTMVDMEERGTSVIPASSVYMAVGMSMSVWELIRDVLVGADLVVYGRDHGLTLTEKGREVGVKCNALLATRAAGSVS